MKNEKGVKQSGKKFEVFEQTRFSAGDLDGMISGGDGLKERKKHRRGEAAFGIFSTRSCAI